MSRKNWEKTIPKMTLVCKLRDDTMYLCDYKQLHLWLIVIIDLLYLALRLPSDKLPVFHTLVFCFKLFYTKERHPETVGPPQTFEQKI